MRLLLLMVLCFLSQACNNGDSYHRSYVISQSQETAAESETVIEPQD